MNESLDPLAVVREARDVLWAAGTSGAVSFAQAIDRWLDHGDQNLEQQLGLFPGWRRLAQHRARDAALKELALRHFNELTVRGMSEAIRRACGRYEASAWRHDEHRPTAGIEGLLWDLLRAGGPPGDARLRDILASIVGG